MKLLIPHRRNNKDQLELVLEHVVLWTKIGFPQVEPDKVEEKGKADPKVKWKIGI